MRESAFLIESEAYMNTEYYRILLRTVEIGNITKAAELLGYTQSGISRIIGKLEEELGTSIVTRNRTGIELRDHAKPLIDTISQIVRLEDQLCQISDNIQKNSSNTIRIATFRTAAVEIIPQLIKGYCEVDPLVHFEITERGRFSYVEEELQSGRVDLAFTADFACADPGFLPLVRDYYYAVLPEGHPLCREKVVTAPMLSSYPFLLSDAAEENENLRNYIALLRDQSDLVRMKMLDDSMTVSMVEKGLGISIVAGAFLQGVTKKVVIRPLADAFYRTIGIVRAQDASENEAIEQFIRYAQRCFPKNRLDEPYFKV